LHKKGSVIEVAGPLEPEEYEYQGVKRTAIKCNVSNFEFPPTTSVVALANESNDNGQGDTPPSSDEDDMPF
jgi:NADPH-dependent glutamate synthase beta subunit-like oxidoreductase